MERIAEEANMRGVIERRKEAADERAGVDIATALPRQELAESELLVLALPNRRLGAALAEAA